MPNQQINIGLTIPRGQLVIASFSGSINLFNRANQFLRMEGLDYDKFTVTTCAHQRNAILYDQYFSVNPDTVYSDAGPFDLVLVPAIEGAPQENIALNGPLISWLRSLSSSKNTEFLSLCTGAFMLGAAGLLDGRVCTTHWADADALQSMFPHAQVKPDRIITDEEGVYTSGGAFSGL
ncbi:MAG: DJ-1/PfpI family protein, partial [Saprospiraceae bacterium]|nr:DJ-1/PfpI family protein [Saprospiraceae bacterium]